MTSFKTTDMLPHIISSHVIFLFDIIGRHLRQVYTLQIFRGPFSITSSKPDAESANSIRIKVEGV